MSFELFIPKCDSDVRNLKDLQIAAAYYFNQKMVERKSTLRYDERYSKNVLNLDIWESKKSIE